MAEEDFRAPSAVKKTPIPPSLSPLLTPYFSLSFPKARGGSGSPPPPRPPSGGCRCRRTRGSRGRRVTRALAGGGPRWPRGPLLLHRRIPGAPRRRKEFSRCFYVRREGRRGARTRGSDRCNHPGERRAQRGRGPSLRAPLSLLERNRCFHRLPGGGAGGLQEPQVGSSGRRPCPRRQLVLRRETRGSEAPSSATSPVPVHVHPLRLELSSFPSLLLSLLYSPK